MPAMTMGVSSQRVFTDEFVAISIDCFVALLLAMIVEEYVIARLPEREAVAISYSKKEVLAKPILLKRRLPRLNAYAFRLAMTKRAKSLRSSQ